MLIRKKLTEAEFSNANLRYNEGCDCVQFTPDGGTTWIDQPANDPRSSDAYRLPPITGSDIRCRAAEGMTALIRQMVDARIEDISSAELAGTILGIVAFIPGFNILWALILAFVSLAFTIAREILEAAFTEEVYDQIRCIFECNIQTNGQMNQLQFDNARADMAVLDAIAQTWVEAVMDLVGAVGMSNAGVALEAAADCDCNCCDDLATITFSVPGCYTFVGYSGFAATTLDASFGNPAPSAKSGNRLTGTGHAAGVRVEVGAVISQISMDWYYTAASGDRAFAREMFMYDGSNNLLASLGISDVKTRFTWHNEVLTYGGSTVCAYAVLRLQINGTGSAGVSYIDNIFMTPA